MLSTSLTTLETTLFLAYPTYLQKTITLLHSNNLKEIILKLEKKFCNFKYCMQF